MADVLKLEDIRAFLHGHLNLRISTEDLKNPNSEVAQKIYISFLRALNFRDENFTQIPFNAMLPNNELYQDATPFAAITLTMSKLLQLINFPSTFFLCDVLSPRPKKFKLIVTHLCQFYQFWDLKMRSFKPMQEDMEKKKSAEDSLEKAIEDRKCFINKLQQEINESEERISSVKDIHGKLAEATAMKEKYSMEKKILKSGEEEMANRLTAVIQEQHQLPSIIDEMNSRLQSPLAEVQQAMQQREAEIKKWEEKCLELQDTEDALADAIKLGQACNKVQELVETDIMVNKQAKNYLECSGRLEGIQKAIQICKNEIMTTEKCNHQNREVLNTLKQQTEKTLWRMQCKIEEENKQLQHVLNENASRGNTNLEYGRLDEQESFLVQTMDEWEEKHKTLASDTAFLMNSLIHHLKTTHQKQKEQMNNILNNIEKFY